MEAKLKIVMIASECVPFAKTGGLADVVGALPKALHNLGHDVRVIIPFYASINPDYFNVRPFLTPLGVRMGDTEEWCAVHTAEQEGVPYYFIESQKYFGRLGLYNDADFKDYGDNPRRFGFFTRAALQLCLDTGFAPDIVHVHDWQTALAPAYLKIWHWDNPLLGRAASLLTIHNIAYQGVYGAENNSYLGLQPGNFTADKFEDYGRINILKGGIVYADIVNTVSPTYAQETRQPLGGNGLTPYLNDKGDHYIGILNGADYDRWNPASDPLIPAHYKRSDLGGKAICKRALQRRFFLEEDPGIPIVGVISRLVAQKGLDLLSQTIDRILNNLRVQFVILGSGDKGLEWFYGQLPARYPGRIGSYIGFSDELSHWIEAGCDFFIMPSIFEPCGLNQMYSLKYGTLPIVRATGGLDDTVEQYDVLTGSGTGFKFQEPSTQAIYDAVERAINTYFTLQPHIQQMIQAAMSRNFTWERSAQQYVQAYRMAIRRRAGLQVKV